ncbi:ADP-ribosylglycohydrolase family protein, partial [Streptomyces sp. NPDC059627]
SAGGGMGAPALERPRGWGWLGAGGTLPAKVSVPTPRPPHPRTYHAAWLGRAVGCLLGKPVEKLPLHAIRELARATGNWPLNHYFTARGVPAELLSAHPWNRRSAATSLAENIDGMPEDDDLNYPLLNLLLLQRHTKGFGTTDVAALWLDELPAGRTFTAERIAYRNLLTGVEPPYTARHRNPFREWIGALIRADVHGWTNPGDPAAAAEQAHRDATLTHTANGVYAAMFTAAVIATAATGTHDVHACLRTGRSVVPPHSRLAHAVDHAIRLAGEHADFDTVVDELHATHSPIHHWVHAIPNTALTAAALTHADGDFTGSVCRAVSGGWDTDSNGATAGSVAGLLAGDPDALPDRWTTPLKNRLATSVAGFDGTGFDALAHLTHLEATRS